MWVRGLKRVVAVSPLARLRSHPMWVRGLKPSLYVYLSGCAVAPYVGAWIETVLLLHRYLSIIVAPYVGAWIETNTGEPRFENWKSHPMWVRGLKLIMTKEKPLSIKSHPMWVRGLKHQCEFAVCADQCRTLCGCVD